MSDKLRGDESRSIAALRSPASKQVDEGGGREGRRATAIFCGLTSGSVGEAFRQATMVMQAGLAGKYVFSCRGNHGTTV